MVVATFFMAALFTAVFWPLRFLRQCFFPRCFILGSLNVHRNSMYCIPLPKNAEPSSSLLAVMGLLYSFLVYKCPGFAFIADS